MDCDRGGIMNFIKDANINNEVYEKKVLDEMLIEINDYKICCYCGKYDECSPMNVRRKYEVCCTVYNLVNYFRHILGYKEPLK